MRHVSFVALEGSSSYLASMVGVRGLRLALNTSVAVLVLSLPFAATAASRASTVAPTIAATTLTATDASRAQPAARGAAIAGSRNPVTAAAETTRSVEDRTVREGDTLATMANYYDVSVEAIAFANGITDAHALQMGQQLVIPPAEGALYTMKDGDTVDSVATHFKVDPAVILTFNRCYFEPERCAAGQTGERRRAPRPQHGPDAAADRPPRMARRRRHHAVLLGWPHRR
jgi:LysM repeat protein